jgi:hypothetical protein
MTTRTLALSLLAWMADTVLAVASEVCEPHQPLGKSKTCPGFKDRETDLYCCPSAIEPGTFYCCDAVRLNELENERLAALRRAFFAK